MNIDTRLVFPSEDVPKNGTMLEIENNVRWIRMPLPMSCLLYTSDAADDP